MVCGLKPENKAQVIGLILNGFKPYGRPESQFTKTWTAKPKVEKAKRLEAGQVSWIDGERVLQAGLRLLPLLSSLVDGATQVEDEVGEGEDLARLRAAHLGSVHLAKSQVKLSSEKPSPDLGVRGVVRVVLGDARRQGACHLAQGSLNLKRRLDKYLENI